MKTRRGLSFLIFLTSIVVMGVVTAVSVVLNGRSSFPFDEAGEYVVERRLVTTVDSVFLCMAYGDDFSSKADAVYHLEEGLEVPEDFVFFEKKSTIDSFHLNDTGLFLEKGQEVHLLFTFRLKRAWYGAKYEGVTIEKME